MQEKIIQGIKYVFDPISNMVYKDETVYLSPNEEKERYDQHQNDLSRTDYFSYQLKLLNELVLPYLVPGNILDFGSGKTEVIKTILNDRKVESYDLYYYPNNKVLLDTYDNIVTIETVEHFRNPLDEFYKLHKMLKPKGHLIVITQFRPNFEEIDQWWYLRDTTHYCFYNFEAFKYICSEIGFDLVSTNHKNQIVLKKK